PDRLGEHRIRRGSPTEGKPAVATTCAARDLASLEEPDLETRLGEGECARAASDSSPDDRDVGRSPNLDSGQRFGGLGEPVRKRGHGLAILDGEPVGPRSRERRLAPTEDAGANVEHEPTSADSGDRYRPHPACPWEGRSPSRNRLRSEP